MELAGSCHCNRVHFTVQSHTPYPYMSCYCSICRKTQGGGGYAINIMGDAATLHVQGMEHVSVYQAHLPDPEHAGQTVVSTARRHFCKHCGSALWIADPRWPQWVYPFASAIDTPLPRPPATTQIMLNYAAPWCTIPAGTHFGEYPDESIEAWHRRQGLYEQ